MPHETVKGLVIPDDAVLVPISGRISIRVEPISGAMYGPLYLPQQSSGDQSVGTVEHVYEPYMDDYGNLIEPVVQPGDIVVIGKYTGTKVSLNRDDFIICREMDVLACIRIPEDNETNPELN